MLYYAWGEAIDMAETLRALPVQPLKSVREYLQASKTVDRKGHPMLIKLNGKVEAFYR